jgi:hypothetical protein
MTCLDLLEEDNIWIVLFDQIFELSFVRDGADTVDIPGDDTHRKKIIAQSIYKINKTRNILYIQKILLDQRKRFFKA